MRIFWHLAGLAAAVAALHCSASPQLIAPPLSTGGAGNFWALQPDGKILVQNPPERFNADGTRDTTFALAGIGGTPVINSQGLIFVVENSGGSNGSESAALVVYNSDGSRSSIRPAVSGLQYQQEHLLLLAGDKILIWSSSGTFLAGPASRALAIARLNADGSYDSSFDAGAGPNSGISAVAAQPDGKLLVGGYFSLFDLAAVRGFVRLNGDGTVDSTFTAPAIPYPYFGNPVPTILSVFSDGRIAAWYPVVSELYFLNADGSVSLQVGTPAGGAIDALALQPDGKILAGGAFTAFAGVAADNLIRLNPDGSVDGSFAPGASLSEIQSPGIQSLAVQSNGGILFGTINSAGPLVRLLPGGTADTGFFSTNPQPGQVMATLKTPAGRTYIAGYFLSVNGVARPGLACLLADGSVDPGFAPSAGPLWTTAFLNSRKAQLVLAADGSVFLVGTLSAVGSQPRPGLAHFLANGALDPNFNPTLSSGGSFSAVTILADGRIVAGGSFSTVNGATRQNLAAFTAAGALDPQIGAVAGTNAAITQVAASPDGGFFLGGAFTTLGGVRRLYLGKVKTDGTVDPQFVPSATDAPTEFGVTGDGRVIVATLSSLTRYTSAGSTDLAYTLPSEIQLYAASPTVTLPAAFAVDSSGGVIVEIDEEGSTSSSGGYNLYGYYALRLDSSGAVDPAFPIIVSDQAAATVSVGNDGSVALGGIFTVAGNTAASGLLFTPAGWATAGVPVVLALPGPVRSNPLPAGANTGGFVATVFGASLTYQWQFNGINIPGATAAIYAPTDVGAEDQGLLSVVVTNPFGSLVQPIANISVTSFTWLANLSARGSVAPGGNPLIAGFVTSGSGAQPLLIRGIGPQLAKSFGLSQAIPDPQLDFFGPQGQLLGENTAWNASLVPAFTSVAAFPLTIGSNDAALLPTVSPGAWTAQVTSAAGHSGTALAEIYEAVAGEQSYNLTAGVSYRLLNLSARGSAGGANGPLVGGFVVGGLTTAETILIRAVGPTLSAFGVPAPLAHPVLTLYDVSGAVIASNAGWSSLPLAGSASGLNAGLEAATAAEMAEVGAFALPANSADCAMIVTLPPGNYTAQVTGTAGSAGTALVELYEMH